jgi:uncharacterized protein (DUF885 family)
MKGVGYPRDVAEREVRRYVATPAQPLSYLLGFHAFRHLRQEAEARGSFDRMRFHGRLLQHGSIPLGYLHERMGKGVG